MSLSATYLGWILLRKCKGQCFAAIALVRGGENLATTTRGIVVRRSGRVVGASEADLGAPSRNRGKLIKEVCSSRFRVTIASCSGYSTVKFNGTIRGDFANYLG